MEGREGKAPVPGALKTRRALSPGPRRDPCPGKSISHCQKNRAPARLRYLLTILVTLLMAAPHAPARDGIFRWIDDKGEVHYGDNPPAAGAEPVVVTAPDGPDPVLDKQRARRQRLLDLMQEDRQAREKKAAADASRDQHRLAACDRARKELKKIQSARFLYRATADPHNPKVLTDAERNSVTAGARAEVNRWCE